MIKKYSLFPLSLFLAVITSVSSAHAQRIGSDTIFPIFDQAQCSDASTYYAEFEPWDENISIGRQLYRSPYRLRARHYDGEFALLTCEINTAEFDTLSLRMGIADNVRPSHDATVKIYQGGNILGEYRQLVGGDMVEYTVDLLNTSVGTPGDIAVEILCYDAGHANDCYLYFVEAELAPTNYVPVN